MSNKNSQVSKEVSKEQEYCAEEIVKVKIINYFLNGGEGTISRVEKREKICRKTVSKVVKRMYQKSILNRKSVSIGEKYSLSKKFYSTTPKEIIKMISN